MDGTSGAIATPHAEATRAGTAALARGGNAIDAAVAAAAVLTVVYPHNCALGGDLFALVRSPDGRVVAVNGSGPAARGVDVEAVRARAGGAMPVVGVDAVTVPGLVAGWGAVHAVGARLSWSDALRGAAQLAREGAAVVPGLAGAIAGASALMAQDAGLRGIFAPDGVPLRAGDTLRQPALARTLDQLIDGGPGAFYEGEIAESLIAGLRAQGSALDLEDFTTLAAEVGAPLGVRFAGLEILTAAPNSSGVLLAQALLALEAAELADPLGAEAGLLAGIFAAGTEQRERELADPKAYTFDAERWLGGARIAAIVDQARDGTAALTVTPPAKPTGDTVAVVASDSGGWAVSLIQSVFHWFGAGILDPATGILMHNRGASFTLQPGHPNVLAPGRRPAHTLMPVLVTKDDNLVGVLGTMGGRVQAQIHTQLLLRLLGGTSPQAAVTAPRFAVGATDMSEPPTTVRVEADADPATMASLTAAGFAPLTVAPQHDDLGHAQAIWRGVAGSDPRADAYRARPSGSL